MYACMHVCKKTNLLKNILLITKYLYILHVNKTWKQAILILI